MTKGYINTIIKSSIVDGPNNRIAIFMQGCNFDCKYCHNPETINMCNNCKKCVKGCPTNALSINNNLVEFDNKKCIDCDQCTTICNSDSSPKISVYTPDELFMELKKYFGFVQGITISGGEALLQQQFILEFFKLVKANTNLTCFIDTNGSVEINKELLEVCDYFMLDVKVVDDVEHINLTSTSNKMVLKNLDLLNNINKLYEVRTVIYPGYDHTNTIDYVQAHIGSDVIYKKIEYKEFGVREKFKEYFKVFC